MTTDRFADDVERHLERSGLSLNPVAAQPSAGRADGEAWMKRAAQIFRIGVDEGWSLFYLEEMWTYADKLDALAAKLEAMADKDAK